MQNLLQRRHQDQRRSLLFEHDLFRKAGMRLSGRSPAL
jgi:hypothetical protein